MKSKLLLKTQLARRVSNRKSRRIIPRVLQVWINRNLILFKLKGEVFITSPFFIQNF